jgi:hypothetical protein
MKNRINVQLLALALCGAMLMVGCASTSTGPTPPAPTPSQIVADVTLGVEAGEALVAALPNIPANVKSEVQAGGALLNSALACIEVAVQANAGGAVEALSVTKCIGQVNISLFSPQAQQYLSAFNAALQVIVAYFTPQTPVATAAEKSQVTSLAKRTVKVGSKVRQ